MRAVDHGGATAAQVSERYERETSGVTNGRHHANSEACDQFFHPRRRYLLPGKLQIKTRYHKSHACEFRCIPTEHPQSSINIIIGFKIQILVMLSCSCLWLTQSLSDLRL